MSMQFGGPLNFQSRLATCYQASICHQKLGLRCGAMGVAFPMQAGCQRVCDVRFNIWLHGAGGAESGCMGMCDCLLGNHLHISQRLGQTAAGEPGDDGIINRDLIGPSRTTTA
jgi:hypothetical protein